MKWVKVGCRWRSEKVQGPSSMVPPRSLGDKEGPAKESDEKQQVR